MRIMCADGRTVGLEHFESACSRDGPRFADRGGMHRPPDEFISQSSIPHPLLQPGVTLLPPRERWPTIPLRNLPVKWRRVRKGA